MWHWSLSDSGAKDLICSSIWSHQSSYLNLCIKGCYTWCLKDWTTFCWNISELPTSPLQLKLLGWIGRCMQLNTFFWCTMKIAWYVLYLSEVFILLHHIFKGLCFLTMSYQWCFFQPLHMKSPSFMGDKKITLSWMEQPKKPAATIAGLDACHPIIQFFLL